MLLVSSKLDKNKILSFTNVIPKKKYVTVDYLSGRLANQIFFLIDGYAIARKLNRQLYFDYTALTKDNLDKNLERINLIFPQLISIYEIFHPPEKPVIFGSSKTTSDFYNVTSLLDHSSEYIHIKMYYGQTFEYFAEYEKDVRDLLSFSPEIEDYSKDLLKRRKVTVERKFLCTHSRRTDFVKLNIGTSMEDILIMLESVSKKHNLTDLALFGDEPNFLKEAVKSLESKIRINETFISIFSEGTDLYIASQLCSAFVITAPVSTFSFWMAYLSNSSHVYYKYETGVHYGKLMRPEIFPKPWIALQIINKTTVEKLNN